MHHPNCANENERLRQLLALRLDAGRPHEELQILCEVAARSLRVPIALVSLVGETEQRFAAAVGLEGIRGLPRDASFCAHSIMSDAPFVVEDAVVDPRFAANPLVIGPPGIRAYAGVPLEVAPGASAGALCVIDTKSRSFSGAELAELRALAKVARRILIAHLENLELLEALDLVSRQRAELEHRARALEYTAAHCGMTGLLNAASFRSRATAIVRLPDVDCCFALIDIDNFKQINDTHGHRFGDIFLETVARAIRSCLPQGALAGRMGGDEFGLLTRGAGAAERLAKTLAQLREELDAAVARLDPPAATTLSIGVAAGAGEPLGFEDLYQNADSALYAAKGRGRDCTIWHTAEPAALPEGKLAETG